MQVEDTEGGKHSNTSDKDAAGAKRSIVVHAQTSDEADDDASNSHFNMSTIVEVQIEEFDDGRGKLDISRVL
jgi:hypothetical protein